LAALQLNIKHCHTFLSHQFELNINPLHYNISSILFYQSETKSEFCNNRTYFIQFSKSEDFDKCRETHFNIPNLRFQTVYPVISTSVIQFSKINICA
jgi:hypothetical protein